jgi:ppGpp synthetase/RelA/SpoT-type nucleotidyltranferase
MNIPYSFMSAYRREKAVADKISRRAGTRLRILCSQQQRGWLVTERVKDPESALAKLQLGMVPRLDAMQDLYGATVVVPTRREIDTAVTALQSEFPGAELVRRRRGDPRTFLYDDTHVLAWLGSHGVGESDEVRERRFEIQVRTGLQFAWWRATHDTVYKGGIRDWRLDRVASQVRGNLEMLDGILANLEKGADLLEARDTDRDQEFELISGWLELWPTAQRPSDAARFVETVKDLLGAGRIDVVAGRALLQDAYGRGLVANPDIPPAQAFLAAVVHVRGLAPLFRRPEKKRWILVTDELANACPPLRKIPSRRLVGL